MNRSELYEAVWSKPLFHVARQLGVGDRTLAAACKKASIPTPPRGHWRKVATGQGIQRPPLGGNPGIDESVHIPKSFHRQQESKASGLPPKTMTTSDSTGERKAAKAVLREASELGVSNSLFDAFAVSYLLNLSRKALLLEVIACLEKNGQINDRALNQLLRLLREEGSE